MKKNKRKDSIYSMTAITSQNESEKPGCSESKAERGMKMKTKSDTVLDEDSENCEDVAGSVKKKTEDILNELGGFSNFQLFVTIVLILPEAFSAMISLFPLITMTSNAPYYCSHGENNNSVSPQEFKTIQNQVQVQVTNVCDINVNNSACPDGTLSPILPYSSVIQEFELLCKHDWIPDSLTSMQMVGSMFGAFCSGVLSDRFGRRRVFFMLIFIMSFFNFVGGLSTELYTFVLSRFMTGFSIGGCFVVYINYLMEFLTPQYRTMCGCVSLWGVGEMLLAILGYLVGGWRNLSWITSVPLFFIVFVYNLVPESPRWLLANQRTTEAKAVFDQIAKWNGRKEVDESEVYKLQENIMMVKAQNELMLSACAVVAGGSGSNEKCQEGFTWKLKQFLKCESNYWRPLFIFSFLWFSSSLIYYGLSFNMKNIKGNIYLKLFFMGLADAVGMLLSFFVSLRCGRKKAFVGFLLGTTLFLFAVILVSEWKASMNESSFSQIITCLCLFGRFFNSASTAVMACFCAETFPTSHRASSMSICSVMGFFGAIIAPQIDYLNALNSSIPYFVFGVLAALSSVVSLFLKEMNGQALKDS